MVRGQAAGGDAGLPGCAERAPRSSLRKSSLQHLIIYYYPLQRLPLVCSTYLRYLPTSVLYTRHISLAELPLFDLCFPPSFQLTQLASGSTGSTGLAPAFFYLFFVFLFCYLGFPVWDGMRIRTMACIWSGKTAAVLRMSCLYIDSLELYFFWVGVGFIGVHWG